MEGRGLQRHLELHRSAPLGSEGEAVRRRAAVDERRPAARQPHAPVAQLLKVTSVMALQRREKVEIYIFLCFFCR